MHSGAKKFEDRVLNFLATLCKLKIIFLKDDFEVNNVRSNGLHQINPKRV